MGQKRVLVVALGLTIIAWLILDGLWTLRSNELTMEKAARVIGPEGTMPEKPSLPASLPAQAAPSEQTAPRTAAAPQASVRTQALEMIARGDYPGAISLLEAEGPSAGNASLYAQALLGRAEEVMASEPEVARGLLEKATAADPKNVQAHVQLGHLQTRSKAYPQAIDQYQAALRLAPESVEALYNLGFIYAADGSPAKAEEMFRRVVALKPDFLDKALFNLAVVQQKLGKRRESMASLEAAVAIRPDNEKAQAYLKALKAGPRETQ
jgi:tetratricopeptide (TPR) repeat protein